MAVHQVKTLDRPKRSLWDQVYIFEIARGLGVTLGHFFGALVKPKENIVTLQYPDETRVYPARYRGQHRLMVRDDGQVRCVACMCCSTICPANCIHITAAEHDDPDIEKYPEVFVIDQLRCIVCGLCVEACPCDAIRMDYPLEIRENPNLLYDLIGASPKEGELPQTLHCKPYRDREKSFMDREDLMSRGTLSSARQGGSQST